MDQYFEIRSPFGVHQKQSGPIPAALGRSPEESSTWNARLRFLLMSGGVQRRTPLQVGKRVISGERHQPGE